MLRTYLPAIVFLVLGGAVGLLFSVMNLFFGPRRPNRSKQMAGKAATQCDQLIFTTHRPSVGSAFFDRAIHKNGV